MKYFFTILICLVSFKVLACAASPIEYTISHEELVKNSKAIYLVMPIQMTLDQYDIETTFDVIETIEGEPKKQLKVVMKALARDIDLATDFDMHEAPDFWKPGIGRAIVLMDCSVATHFDLGYQYLLFADNLNNAKSFELVHTNEDKWYKYVKTIKLSDVPTKFED